MSEALALPTTAPVVSCIHCGTRVPLHRKDFCCDGCESVYGWLKNHGLDDYYRLRDQGQSFRAARPVTVSDQTRDFAYLDAPGLLGTRIDPRTLTFYLEGFHCYACIWLLEQLPQHLAGLEKLEFDPTESTARVKIRENGRFSEVAMALAQLGYRPHLLPDETVGKTHTAQLRERRMNLMRLAVAGAAAGNIMMFALAVYAGAPRGWERGFNWISFFLYLPAIGFSATPLFREAIAALRNRRLAVEIPLMTGIAIASLYSTYNLFSGSDRVFFDSLSSLLFLLLASRAVLNRIQSSAMRKNHLLALLTPGQIEILSTNGESRYVDHTALAVGDRIRVAPHSVIPVDGTVFKGSSHVSRAALTGESKLERATCGSWLEAGSRNQESELQVEVQAQGYSTRLGRILRAIESGAIRKPQLLVHLDRWSGVFVAIVGLAAAAAWALGGWERAVSLLIIVCPCGLALAGPLTFAQGLGAAARRGIWIQSGAALERLTLVNMILFDKTGTLTRGQPEVVSWKWFVSESEHRASDLAILAIEKKSLHPVAAALVAFLEERHLSIQALPEVTDLQETLGVGISGVVNGKFWEILKSTDASESVRIQRDGQPVATLTLRDAPRSEAADVIANLKSQQIETWLLSGDQMTESFRIGEAIGISQDHILGQLTPEEKLHFVQEHPLSLFVGDGANDAAALNGAAVSATLRGSAELALRSSDIFLGEAGISGIPDLLRIARQTIRVLQIAIGLSLFYNAAAIVLVLQGQVAPWVAAIIMPLSAFSVFSTTRLGFRRTHWRNA